MTKQRLVLVVAAGFASAIFASAAGYFVETAYGDTVRTVLAVALALVPGFAIGFVLQRRWMQTARPASVPATLQLRWHHAAGLGAVIVATYATYACTNERILEVAVAALALAFGRAGARELRRRPIVAGERHVFRTFFWVTLAGYAIIACYVGFAIVLPLRSYPELLIVERASGAAELCYLFFAPPLLWAIWNLGRPTTLAA